MENRDWQEDINQIRAVRIIAERNDDNLALIEILNVFEYWLNQVKQLKEDNARLTCQFTGAEQKYLTQSNTIADLRNELEQIKSTAEIKYIQHTREKHEKETTLLIEHISKAEEREQNLKEAIQNEIDYYGDLYGGRGINLRELLSTLYPLDREDTTNET